MSTLAEQVVEQLKTDMDNVYDAGYQKGLKEVGGLDVSKFGIQNEVTGTNIVTCDYVNENEHNVEVKLSSDTVTDFSGVEVKCIGKNWFNINGDINQYYQGLLMHDSNCNKLNDDGTISINASSSVSVGRGFKVKGIATKTLTISFDVVSVGTGKGVSTSICIPSQINYDLKSNVSAGNRLILTKTFGVDVDEAIFTFYVNSGTGGIIKNVQIEVFDTATECKPYTEKTYTANADGTVDGVTSISPVMNIICDTENVDITAKYYCVQDVEWHRFWDNYQEFGERTHYEGAFAGIGWNKENLKPKYQITPINAQRMFYGSAITDMKTFCETNDIIIDFSQITTNGMLSYLLENSLIEIFIPVDVSGLPKLTNIFRGASNLKVAELVGVNTNQEFDAVYAFCSELREVYIDGVVGKNIALNNSALLSEGSIQRVIDVLADLTGQATQTLTLHANVKAKLTEEQIATITSKNWTLA